MGWQFLFDTILLLRSAEPKDEGTGVYLVDRPRPVRFDVEVDELEMGPEENDGSGTQLQNMFFTLELVVA